MMLLLIIVFSWFLVGFLSHQFLYWLDGDDSEEITGEYLQMMVLMTLFGYASFFIVVTVFIKEEATWSMIAEWINKSKKSDKK